MGARVTQETYADRAAAHTARRDRERRQSALIARARLAVFLAAAGMTVWMVADGFEPPRAAVTAGLLAVFAALVVWHARVEGRAAWHEALRVTCEHARARVDRRWDDLPPGEPPPSLDVVHHPYAHDLDLFGRASLFQWLGPAATPGGSRRLAEWLLTPSPPEEAVARQAAVRELAAAGSWREGFAAHGLLAAGADHGRLERFLDWAEGSRRRRRLLKASVAGILAAIWLGLALDAASGWWMVPLLAGMVLSFAAAGTLHAELDRAGAGLEALARYAAIFEHACGARFDSPALRALQKRLSADGMDAPRWMGRLNRILAFAELRRSAALLHFPIQSLTLWDFHVLFALDRWRRVAGPHVREWMSALADIDALAAFAAVRHDNPGWADAVFDAEPRVAARALGHPILPEPRRVANDVEVGPPGTLLLVTGSNMSGKSTLLRSIGLNVVLAQAGAPVCAAAFRMPAIELQTSIRIQDSLELGLSYFMAALARLKGVVDAAERPREGRVLLYLLDEILQGTNSAERGLAVQGIARHLLAARAIGVMTTHDLNLAGEEPLKSSARLVHFTETVDPAGAMHFDYRLRDGLATSRNALRLMEMIGISLEGR